MKRFAVDVGGTFTDVIYADDETGEFRFEKVRSTPSAPELAVLDSLRRIGADNGGVGLFVHGTTISLNSLLQGKIPKTALISTVGFRDILEIARCNRPDNQQYNVFWTRPEPFVPRPLRLEVSERTSFDGKIMTEVNEEEVRGLTQRLMDQGVYAVAVSLLNSYANPENEDRIEATIKAAWPGATVSLSHRVAAEWREFERTSTTVMDAAIKKPLREYIHSLTDGLAGLGFRGQVLIMHCAGGTLTAETAAESPISTIISGPVGGSIGAVALGEALGIKNIVTADPGGTSFDVSMIIDGKSVLSPDLKLIEKATSYPAIIPSVDIRSIGAGGGSIARVDERGLLHVGPESAGAEPGPMCYGRQGTKPTVTDAAVVNGIIDTRNFLGGEVQLYPELAEKGVEEIAAALQMGVHEAADGILTVARDSMASAVREILIGEGYDPVDFAMVSYGGAGGLFATHIAKDIGIRRVVIPVAPAYFSAWGMLRSDIIHTFSQTYFSKLDTLDVRTAREIYSKMEASASELLAEEGIAEDRRTYVYSIDMRYENQGHNTEIEISGDLEKPGSLEEIKRNFHVLHEAKYGHRLNASVFTVNFRLRSVGRLEKPKIPEIPVGGRSPQGRALKGRRMIYTDGGSAECEIYDRRLLLSGNTIEGPAIVEEPSHTTLLTRGQTLTVDKFGDLIIEIT